MRLSFSSSSVVWEKRGQAPDFPRRVQRQFQLRPGQPPDIADAAQWSRRQLRHHFSRRRDGAGQSDLYGVLNLIIFIVFALAKKATHEQLRNSERFEEKHDDRIRPKFRRETNPRRIRILWVGLGMYVLIALNAIRYVHRLPYSALAAGFLVNAAIIVTILVAIRRAYRGSEK